MKAALSMLGACLLAAFGGWLGGWAAAVGGIAELTLPASAAGILAALALAEWVQARLASH